MNSKLTGYGAEGVLCNDDIFANILMSILLILVNLTLSILLGKNLALVKMVMCKSV